MTLQERPAAESSEASLEMRLGSAHYSPAIVGRGHYILALHESCRGSLK